MKYIRTKDGIYEVVDTYEVSYVIGYTEDGFEKKVYKEDIIKQADTIEELCDEFVYCYRDDMSILANEEQIKQIILVGRIQDVRGAIWTDKGLIFVAKMNDKGELELI